MNVKDLLIKDLRKVINIYGFLNPMIGGTTSLYLQGCNLREPSDIDIYFKISKEEFLKIINARNILIPDTVFPLDWGFYPNLESTTIEIEGIPCQRILDILEYKEEFEDVCPGGNVDKHLRDIKFIKKYIMEQLFDNLSEIKEQLFDAPTEVKTAFNDVVQYFSIYTKTWYVICETNGKPRFIDYFSTGNSAADVEDDYKKAIEKYFNLEVLRVKAFPAEQEYIYPEKSRSGKRGKICRIIYDKDAVKEWKSQSK